MFKQQKIKNGSKNIYIMLLYIKYWKKNYSNNEHYNQRLLIWTSCTISFFLYLRKIINI